jgi:SAM-dependent methyltransferase
MMAKVVRADTGMGTTYERFSLKRLLGNLMRQYEIRSVLEGPIDGITGIAGINSLTFAKKGARVSVVLPNQETANYARHIWEKEGCRDRGTFFVIGASRFDFPDDSFDLVWNFNALPRIDNFIKVVTEMVRVSKRYVLIFVSNRSNYGFWVHRLHHKVAKAEWDHGDIALMDTERIGRILQEKDMRIIQKLFVDIPWWPDVDILMSKLASDLLPFLRPLLKKTQQHDQRYKWDVNNLPYFDKEKYRDLHLKMNRLGFIERTSITPLKALFAHHRGILAEKKGL